MKHKTRTIPVFLSVIAVFLFVGISPATEVEPSGRLVLPIFTAYSEPDPEILDVSRETGTAQLTDSKTTYAWYGLLRTTGELKLELEIKLPKGQRSELRLQAANHSFKAKVVGTGKIAVVPFGSISIPEAGSYRFALTGANKSVTTFGELKSLVLTGTATKDALFNQTWQRGAPSVHLGYPVPKDEKVEWFYNEVTVKTDPLWTYYEVCGFSRGYFGIQVNSPTERRIIFSVWDSGDETVDRGKVAKEDRVELLAKGAGVVASDFGNEGTGGHSHLVYPWKTGATYRFLVSARPEGTATVYTGYFYFPDKQRWEMIASFRAPRDGGYLRRLYSFSEDFGGANGYQQRLAEFGNQWVKTIDGRWSELTTARFTHTAINKYKDRLDRGAGVVGNRFYLTNGGYKPEAMEYGATVTRPAAKQQPTDIALPEIQRGSRH